MNELNTLLNRVSLDVQKLEAKSEVKVISAVLSGSRRWGYSGATSDHDIFLIFENRDRPQLFEPFEDFRFSTGDGFNYTGKRLDKFLRQIAQNKVESLEILVGEPLIETTTHDVLHQGAKKLEKHFNYYDIASGYRGMTVSDMKKLQQIDLVDTKLSYSEWDVIVKLTCTMVRSTICTLYYQQCIEMGVTQFFAGRVQDFVQSKLKPPLPPIVPEIGTLLNHRRGDRMPPVILREIIQKILPWTVEIVNGDRPERPPVIGGPSSEKYYSPLKTIEIMMAMDGFKGHAVNRMNDPLQRECEQLYTDIQRMLR